MKNTNETQMQTLQPMPDSESIVQDVSQQRRFKNRISIPFIWLFSKPHLPLIFAVSALFLAFTDSVVALMQQPAVYWLDYKQAYFGLTYFLMSINPWVYLISIAVYLFVVGLILKAFNRLVSLPLWMVVCFSHLHGVINLTRCGVRRFFTFSDTFSCGYNIGVSIIISMLLGVVLSLYVAKVSMGATQRQTSSKAKKLGRGISVGIGAVWICVLIVGLFIVSMPPEHGWRPIALKNIRPEARLGGQIAYDTQRKVAVLFGGSGRWIQADEWEILGDTWEWNGAEWLPKYPTTSPSRRVAHAMAYDPKRDVVVLYGGSDSASIVLSDTWEWDGEDWKERCSLCPIGLRAGHRMFYDPLREKVVLYAGFSEVNGNRTFYNDAWEWDGERWTPIAFDGQSPVASGFEVAYDLEKEHLTAKLSGYPGGTWLWQGETWKKLDFYEEPLSRSNFGFVYDPNRKITLLFGGINDGNLLGDTWEFDGESWHNIETLFPLLEKRWGHTMFYDAVRERIVIFGGYNGAIQNDMWEYIPGND